MAADILRTAEGFEKCSQNRVRVGYLSLESDMSSLLENESRSIILHNQALPKFCTHERSWSRGHGDKMYAHGDVFFFVFFFFSSFLRFDPAFFPLFSLFPSLSFAFYCAFCMLGHLSRA